MRGLLHERHVAVKWYKMRHCTPTDGAGERKKIVFRGGEKIIKGKILGTNNK